MTQPPSGSGFVCLDATPLIHFNRVGRLDLLGQWFPRAFVPAVVLQQEIANQRSRHRENQKILDADFIEEITLDEPADMKLVSEIHNRFGREAGRDQGEAEVVVASLRFGWTAIIDDTAGQTAARDHEVACCSILTVVLVASSQGMISSKDAWKLHGELEGSRGPGRSALGAHRAHRECFETCISEFRRVGERHGQPWPTMLALPGLDGAVVTIRRRTAP